MSFTQISPGKRILFIMLLSAVSVHNLNNQDDKLQEVLDQKISEDKVKEYDDL